MNEPYIHRIGPHLDPCPVTVFMRTIPQRSHARRERCTCRMLATSHIAAAEWRARRAKEPA